MRLASSLILYSLPVWHCPSLSQGTRTGHPFHYIPPLTSHSIVRAVLGLPCLSHKAFIWIEHRLGPQEGPVLFAFYSGLLPGHIPNCGLPLFQVTQRWTCSWAQPQMGVSFFRGPRKLWFSFGCFCKTTKAAKRWLRWATSCPQLWPQRRAKQPGTAGAAILFQGGDWAVRVSWSSKIHREGLFGSSKVSWFSSPGKRPTVLLGVCV